MYIHTYTRGVQRKRFMKNHLINLRLRERTAAIMMGGWGIELEWSSLRDLVEESTSTLIYSTIWQPFC